MGLWGSWWMIIVFWNSDFLSHLFNEPWNCNHSLIVILTKYFCSDVQWRTWMTFGLQYMQTAIGCTQINAWFAVEWCMHKGLNALMWQTCVKLVQTSKTQEQRVVRDVYPTSPTWRAIALRWTVNFLRSWYKLPFTLTTHHSYLFSCTLPLIICLLSTSECNYAERQPYTGS